jgi:hypothetical protein
MSFSLIVICYSPDDESLNDLKRRDEHKKDPSAIRKINLNEESSCGSSILINLIIFMIKNSQPGSPKIHHFERKTDYFPHPSKGASTKQRKQNERIHPSISDGGSRAGAVGQRRRGAGAVAPSLSRGGCSGSGKCCESV